MIPDVFICTGPGLSSYNFILSSIYIHVVAIPDVNYIATNLVAIPLKSHEMYYICQQFNLVYYIMYIIMYHVP